MDQKTFIDILGWIGVITVLLAYLLLTARKLSAYGVVYQGLNVLGAGLLIVNSYYYRAIPSVAVNVFWILIGLYALARVRLSRRKSQIPS